jgi:hypothetical protein
LARIVAGRPADLNRRAHVVEHARVLVDTTPHGATVFWRGHGMGWIKDEAGRAFRYAMIPAAKLL